MDGVIEHDGQTYAIALCGDGKGGYRLPDGIEIACEEGQTLRIGSERRAIKLARDRDRLWLHFEGRTFEAVLRHPVSHFAAEASIESADVVHAPMPGVIVSIFAAPGDVVSAGQTVMVIESMKLEAAIRSPRDGIVEKITGSVGATFESNAVLVMLAPLA